MRLLRLLLILTGWFFLLYAAFSNVEITPKELVKCIVWAVIIIENGIQYMFLTHFKKEDTDNDKSDD